MTVYINCQASLRVETIDEFPTRKEALEALPEHKMAYRYMPGLPYLSSRATKAWRESCKPAK